MGVVLNIKGIPGLDGDYQLDMEKFKNKDHRTIKQQSGLRVLEYQEAMENGDVGFIVSVAGLVLEKDGKRFTYEQLWDADDNCLSWHLHCDVCDVLLPDEAEITFCEEHKGDARPPVVENSPELANEKNTSGKPSLDSTEPYPVILTPTGYGFPPLDTGSDSDPATFFSLLQPN